MPAAKGKVNMFVCGPTVQGMMHMGHARTYVFYDVVARYLAHLGYRVRFVMNITDIDERITAAARLERSTPEGVAGRYTRLFLRDMKRLKISTVTDVERVSDFLPEMERQVSRLLDSGHAYAVDGWVYFDTSTFPAFGQLSHMSKRELSLHPLELSLKKRALTDFAIWRPEVLVEGKWSTPWGTGSPGWHIQDTAVSMTLLGDSYDLHGGAYELIYPHHEAEIAQAESLTGKSPFVKYWVHTHLVNMEGAKMSKSAGNVFTVEDALKIASPDALRLFLLKKHYRLDMDMSGVESAEQELERIRSLARESRAHGDAGGGRRATLAGFHRALNDDLDVPAAITALEAALASGASEGARKEALLLASSVLGIDLGTL